MGPPPLPGYFMGAPAPISQEPLSQAFGGSQQSYGGGHSDRLSFASGMSQDSLSEHFGVGSQSSQDSQSATSGLTQASSFAGL